MPIAFKLSKKPVNATFSHQHNTREIAPTYLLPQNERLKNFHQNFKNVDDYKKEAITCYEEKTGQKIQKHTKFFQEGILVFGREELEKMYKIHKDKTKDFLHEKLNIRVKEYAKYLNEKFGFEILETSLHCDEGHIQEGKTNYNIHAHILLGNVNLQNGRTCQKRVGREGLRDMQDKCADIFKNWGFARGQPNSKKVALNHKEYKAKAQEKQLEIDTIKAQYERKIKLIEEKKDTLQAETIQNLQKEIDKLKSQINDYQANTKAKEEIYPVTEKEIKYKIEPYLNERNISLETAKESGATFMRIGNYHYIGLEQQGGGYAIRNKEIKRNTQGGGGASFLDDEKSKTLCVFEGLFDYLAYLEYQKNKNINKKMPKRNFLVLNSTENANEKTIKAILEQKKDIEKVILYLDKDDAGNRAENALKSIFKQLKPEIQVSTPEFYTNAKKEGVKDFSDFWDKQQIIIPKIEEQEEEEERPRLRMRM